MSEVLEEKNIQFKEQIIEKEILDVPYSNEVDYATFSRVLDADKVAASYKMYWLLVLLDEVSRDNIDIEFSRMICKMIVYAWYPIKKFKLSFGKCDNLSKVVQYISDINNTKDNYNKEELFKYIYNSDDKELNKQLKSLTLNVPYRFLSPFYRDRLKGKRNAKEVANIVVEESSKNNRAVYGFYTDENNEIHIKINDNWINYLKYNHRILKGWTFYNLVCFLQKRNPNVPGIPFKLEYKEDRNLKKQTEIWKEILGSEHANDIKDIYTDLEFIEENYKEHGTLSLDHFVPWSFVSHNQIWNLIPTFKNINSSKGDKLLNYDIYIDKVCEMQHKVFKFLVDDKIQSNKYKNELEEYTNFVRLEDTKSCSEYNDFSIFCDNFKRSISPIYNIAKNQGFAEIDKIDFKIKK